MRLAAEVQRSDLEAKCNRWYAVRSLCALGNEVSSAELAWLVAKAHQNIDVDVGCTSALFELRYCS
jgi:hypothetical protein